MFETRRLRARYALPLAFMLGAIAAEAAERYAIDAICGECHVEATTGGQPNGAKFHLCLPPIALTPEGANVYVGEYARKRIVSVPSASSTHAKVRAPSSRTSRSKATISISPRPPSAKFGACA